MTSKSASSMTSKSPVSGDNHSSPCSSAARNDKQCCLCGGKDSTMSQYKKVGAQVKSFITQHCDQSYKVRNGSVGSSTEVL